MLDIVRSKTFRYPDREVKKSKYADETLLRITSFYFSMEDQALIAGLSSGKMLMWGKKGLDQNFVTKGKDYETKEFQVTTPHKGDIMCILLEKIQGRKYLVTGSVDRTIKLWEFDPKSKNIVQTMVGHGGTVLCLAYDQENGILLSGSNDRVLKIWRQEPGRELLYYPGFTCIQTLTNFSVKKMLSQHPLITAMSTRSGENPGVYVGDSEGNVHFLRHRKLAVHYDPHPYEIEKTNIGVHRLSVIQLLVVLKENILFSIGYDQKIVAYEANTGKQFYTMSNPHKCIFTAIDWDYEQQVSLSSLDSISINIGAIRGR
eukprot:TRINITY_DN4728_c0_g2_i5.p1 TRINITY_DN4728_c0_g2~~TRINITY_DN4728_c0_g2_i5.p1  ORF type:complete len:316 (-),score=45.38 TRINITY_DN4728_c0_g2_i5:1735-2682(-)